MLIISSKAENKLRWYRKRFVSTKTPQENGRSAFWLWYDKIQEQIQYLEQIGLSLGNKQTYNMKYWGNIIYTCLNLPKTRIVIIIEDFQFDKYNFTNWLNHAPLNEIPFTKKLNKQENWVNTERPIYPIQNKRAPICQSLGARGIYKVQTSNGKWYVCNKYLKPIGNKYLYDEIKRFGKHKDGVYAIGIVQNQTWKIGTNGLIIRPNTNISTDSKGNYISANGDGVDYVSEHKIYTASSNTIKLTESEFHTLISECVRKILKQVI